MAQLFLMFNLARISSQKLTSILTDGKEWRVYFPMIHGSIQERLIRTIDFLNNDVEDISIALRQFLSFENSKSGKSVEIANEISKAKRSRQLAKSKIDEAWSNLTTGPEAKIIDLIIQETSRISGTPPQRQDIVEYLGQMKSLPQVVKPSPTPPKKNKDEYTYWMYNEKCTAKNLTAAYRIIMDELVQHIGQDQLDTIKCIYSSKKDIAKSHQKTAYRLSNGMCIHTYTDTKTKLKQMKVTCDAASVPFGEKSGLFLS